MGLTKTAMLILDNAEGDLAEFMDRYDDRIPEHVARKARLEHVVREAQTFQDKVADYLRAVVRFDEALKEKP